MILRDALSESALHVLFNQQQAANDPGLHSWNFTLHISACRFLNFKF
jgi:hypothetical protein